MHIRRIILSFILLLGCITSTHAASSYRIAAIVNDDVITQNDVEERMRLAIALTGIKNSPDVRKRMTAQVMRAIIDEALQLQEAKRKGASPKAEDVEAAIATIREQNNFKEGTLEQFLASNNISMATMVRQLEAQIAWSRLMAKEVRPRVKVNDIEVSETIEALAGTQRHVSVRVDELLLPVNDSADAEDVRELAEQLLEELREGADFATLKQQFSGSEEAALSKAQDEEEQQWKTLSALPGNLAQAIESLTIGEISAPIYTVAGYHIVKLLDRREAILTNRDDTEVLLRQIIVPINQDAPQGAVTGALAEARELKQSINGCAAFERTAASMDMPLGWDLGRTQLKTLYPTLRDAVRELQVGEISEPFRTEYGIHLITVCERIDADKTLIDRDRIKNGLFQKKMALESRRYMRNLRREAFVEIRK